MGWMAVRVSRSLLCEEPREVGLGSSSICKDPEAEMSLIYLKKRGTTVWLKDNE